MSQKERLRRLEDLAKALKIQVMDLRYENLFLRQTIDDIRQYNRADIPNSLKDETESEKEYRLKDEAISRHIRNQEVLLRLPKRDKNHRKSE